jgi:hypothetical protein
MGAVRTRLSLRLLSFEGDLGKTSGATALRERGCLPSSQ